MKFSGKMCLKIILKVTKSQGFTLSVGDTFFEKLREGGVKLTPLPAVLGLMVELYFHGDNLFGKCLLKQRYSKF